MGNVQSTPSLQPSISISDLLHSFEREHDQEYEPAAPVVATKTATVPTGTATITAASSPTRPSQTPMGNAGVQVGSAGMQMSAMGTMVETETSTRAQAETTTTETVQDFTQLSARIEEALALQVRGANDK